ncbi:ABC transporter ATP-binding protein [Undibacterium sp. TS12]|uniref:ABC transporter ATP-binding protein n=1 Tax=Undibacterium sp. TS12 TaxID=2908202 RepID=UPI001F4CC6D0|nr:ABC transporter ATP-binding protein [Undibacterium sp. TS12]MCH8618886.1 ABC transporter ATP-binding protein [Undibacterium sp. TS12]
MNYLLEIDNISTAYGHSQVLFGVNLQIPQGEVVSLLGRNGAGKTTTLRSIFGLTPAYQGHISFMGQHIEKLTTDRIARLGIALVPEGRQIFPNLTVKENMLAFATNRNNSKTPWGLEQIYQLFPRLAERASNMGNQLSGGEQQMLAISRALMTNPHLLILDEATEGLSPLVREEIWSCLRKLREQGQTILVIDKYVEKLIPLANHHAIMERGKIVWQGNSEQLAATPETWQKYVGV